MEEEEEEDDDDDDDDDNEEMSRAGSLISVADGKVLGPVNENETALSRPVSLTLRTSCIISLVVPLLSEVEIAMRFPELEVRPRLKLRLRALLRSYFAPKPRRGLSSKSSIALIPLLPRSKCRNKVGNGSATDRNSPAFLRCNSRSEETRDRA